MNVRLKVACGLHNRRERGDGGCLCTQDARAQGSAGRARVPGKRHLAGLKAPLRADKHRRGRGILPQQAQTALAAAPINE